jgi:hypothetical protein
MNYASVSLDIYVGVSSPGVFDLNQSIKALGLKFFLGQASYISLINLYSKHVAGLAYPFGVILPYMRVITLRYLKMSLLFS